MLCCVIHNIIVIYQFPLINNNSYQSMQVFSSCGLAYLALCAVIPLFTAQTYEISTE